MKMSIMDEDSNDRGNGERVNVRCATHGFHDSRFNSNTRSDDGESVGWNENSGRSIGAGYAGDERYRSIRPSVESRRYLSFSVSIVNIEVAPNTVNFAAPHQHC